MAEATRQDVLGQKAQAARRAHEARAMSPGKALRRALSRTADVLWDLALVVQDVHLVDLDQDGVVAALGDNDLLILLDGPDGALGLVSVDREVMTGVIEVQTIRQVTQMAVEDRPLTQTDAAMMAPLIDGMLERMVANLEGDPMCRVIEGFRFGAMLEDARGASLLLEAPGYRMFRANADLALGRRCGAIQVVLPDRSAAHGAAAPDPATAGPGPHADALMQVPVKLDAVLCRVSVPLSRARALAVGDVLDLPGDALGGLTLQAPDADAIAGGKLGQLNGMRAVRLSWPAGKAGAIVPEVADIAAAAAATPLADIDMTLPVAQPMPEPAPAMAPVASAETEDLSGFDIGDFDPAGMDIGADDAAAEAEANGGAADAFDAGDFDFAAAPLDLQAET